MRISHLIVLPNINIERILFSSEGRFKLRKCSDGGGKCVEVPEKVIFELYNTIDNLKNAFNNPLDAGRTARTMPMPRKNKCKRGNKKKRRVCMRRSKKRAARNQVAPGGRKKNWGTGKINRGGR